MLAALVWCYASYFVELSFRLLRDPDYQYGLLVPFFAGYMLWSRRKLLPRWDKYTLWGFAFLGLAAATLWMATYFYFTLALPLSIVPCLVGVVLLLGGWPALKWAWPALLFIVFMVPLPGFIGNALSHPLQSVGTIAGTHRSMHPSPCSSAPATSTTTRAAST